MTEDGEHFSMSAKIDEMAKIKPKMVDGEAVCSGENCPSWFHVHTPLGDFMCRASRLYLARNTVCWPYYRAAIAPDAGVARIPTTDEGFAALEESVKNMGRPDAGGDGEAVEQSFYKGPGLHMPTCRVPNCCRSSTYYNADADVAYCDDHRPTTDSAASDGDHENNG